MSGFTSKKNGNKSKSRKISAIQRQKLFLEFSKRINELSSSQALLNALMEVLETTYNFDILFLSDLSREPDFTTRETKQKMNISRLNEFLNEISIEKLSSDHMFSISNEMIEYQDLLDDFGIKTMIIVRVDTHVYSDYFLGFASTTSIFDPTIEDHSFFLALANIVSPIISNFRIRKSIVAANLALHENAERIQRENEQRRELLRKVSSQTKELKQKNIEMEEFVYTISHDLKAPLISIQGFIAALSEDYYEQLSDNARFYVDRISKNMMQIESMIKEILEYSRIGRITQEKEHLNLRKIIDESLMQFSNQVKASDIEINFVGEFPTIYAEKNRMLQLFSNLIGNSIKYRGDQPNPFIEIGIMNVNSKFVTVYVKDNGIGIPKDFHDKVFNIFSRSKSVKDQKIEGTGIGLAHVKKIIETHGGSIWMESEEKVGTTMFFKLPLAA
ncbi:MAG: ATP-binding protein [Candidatus Hermodarchaeota archaeon]